MYKKIVLTIIIFSLFTLGVIPSEATSTTTIFVDPPMVTGLDIGDTFSINVSIAQVTDLGGWDFKLYYRNTVLNATNATKGPFLETAGSTFFYVVNFTDTYNATHGFMRLACTLIGAGPGANGTGTLATITFKIVGSGFSILHLADTDLIDSVIPPNHIPHTTADGAVETGSHDIAITSVIPYKTIVGQGLNLYINTTIANEGNFTETFNVTAYADTTTIETLTNIPLTSGNSTTIIFTWNTTGVPCGNYTITANATIVLGEIDTADNTYTDGWVVVTIIGDVSGDFKVDGLDKILVGIALFTVPGTPNWNANADVSGDDKVDGLDKIIVGIHLFESCP